MFRFPAGWHFITVWCSLDLSVVTAVDLYKNCCCSFRISWFVLWSKSSSNVTVPPLCPAVQCRVENEIDKVVLTHHWNCHPLWRRNNPRIWHISDTEYLPRPGTLVGNTWRTNLPATEPSFLVHVSSCHGQAFSWGGCSRQLRGHVCVVKRKLKVCVVCHYCTFQLVSPYTVVIHPICA